MTVEVENSQTNSLRVNPGRFKVGIKGTPTFLVKGNAQEATSMGVSYLVLVGVLALVFDLQEIKNRDRLETNSKNSTPLE